VISIGDLAFEVKCRTRSVKFSGELMNAGMLKYDGAGRPLFREIVNKESTPVRSAVGGEEGARRGKASIKARHQSDSDGFS